MLVAASIVAALVLGDWLMKLIIEGLLQNNIPADFSKLRLRNPQTSSAYLGG
ncbi:MAG: hypothetical protein HYZ51_01185 [Candidatus Doudnabacteria bacterium]|nr:hypothetical protein [Candidatus Doudnabacteria bacterium]